MYLNGYIKLKRSKNHFLKIILSFLFSCLLCWIVHICRTMLTRIGSKSVMSCLQNNFSFCAVLNFIYYFYAVITADVFFRKQEKKHIFFLFNNRCLLNLIFDQIYSIDMKLNHFFFYFKTLFFWISEVTSMQYKLFTSVTSPSDKHLSLYNLVFTGKFYLVLDEELEKAIIPAL